MSNDWLFTRDDLTRWLDNRLREAIGDAQRIPRERVLSEEQEKMISDLVSRYEVAPPLLRLNERRVQTSDVLVDVSQDPRRAIIDRSRPVHVQGTRVEMRVPFDGDACFLI
ncbi:hypothetical protein HRbin30_03282 [bacterium HR30]|nr:hypothetical protein HRbin30_03282 [bacterium HR30]